MQRLPTPLALCFGPFATLPADQLVRELAENPHTSASRLRVTDSAALPATPGAKTPGSHTLDPGTPASKPGQAAGGAEGVGTPRASWFSRVRDGASALQGTARSRRGGSVKPVGSTSPDSPPGGWPDLELGSLGGARNGAAPAARMAREDADLEQGGASTPAPATASGAPRQAGAAPRAAADGAAAGSRPALDAVDASAGSSSSLAEPTGVLRVTEDGGVELRKGYLDSAGAARLQRGFEVCLMCPRQQLCCMQSRVVDRDTVHQHKSCLHVGCLHGRGVATHHDVAQLCQVECAAPHAEAAAEEAGRRQSEVTEAESSAVAAVEALRIGAEAPIYGKVLVEAAFREIFPDSFQTVLPVRNHKARNLSIRERSIF